MAFNRTIYSAEYRKEKYDTLQINLPKGQKEVIQSRAKELDLSMAAYFQKLVEKDLNGEINWD